MARPSSSRRHGAAGTYGLARYAGVNAWLAGLAMVLLGVLVESVVILLDD